MNLDELTGAELSVCKRHRFWLLRRWKRGPLLLWVMLNPSTATATVDDATIRRCIGFAEQWGYAGIVVCNLYTLRATSPKDLYRELELARYYQADERLRALLEHPDVAPQVICAWGDLNKRAKPRAREVHALIVAAGKAPQCLGRTADGNPRHPVRLAYATPLEPFTLQPLEA